MAVRQITGGRLSAIDYSLPAELLELETIQLNLVHDYQSSARDGLRELIARIEGSIQFDSPFRAEVIRQLNLALQFLSGKTRDPKRAARRIHRVTKAIFTLVRSNYTASFPECFPPDFVHIQIRMGDHIEIDEDIPPDP